MLFSPFGAKNHAATDKRTTMTRPMIMLQLEDMLAAAFEIAFAGGKMR